MEYEIKNLKTYPQDGRHQKCIIDLPFEISKGRDGFVYNDKSGKQKEYNYNLGKIDERWIAFMEETHNPSLEKIFEVKCHKDLDVVIEYCIKVYKKSLEMELKRILAKD